MKLTISGARGFVGTRLRVACASSKLETQSVSLRAGPPAATDPIPQGAVLVHIAAIAHSDDPDEDQVYAVNRDLVITTAERARAAGYQQFIFLSSALVWGSAYESVNPTTPERPNSAYGRAKLEAEENLRRLESAGFGVTILRPPLVYGPDVKGNLAKMLRAVHRWPVCPLGVAENRRSLLHVDDLAAAIIHLARTGTRGTFSPADTPSVSSLEILTRMATQMPSHGKIIAMPHGARWALRRLVPGAARRLFGSFVITDDSLEKTGFVPPFSMDDGFEKMVGAYLQTAAEYKQQ